MSNLRARSNTLKIFLLSGISDGVRKDLARKIHLLGGRYFDIQDFKAMCTHVVCGRLSHSEKFLGACATGKWVLHPDYVQDSYIAGCWLDEEQYEWCDDYITHKYKVDMTIAVAARRWRFLLGDGCAAFTGWRVAVIAGAKRSKVIKRLLISGGAEVFNIKIPVKNPAKVADTIGYIFVSEQNMKSVIHLIDYGVLCIRPEFIGDFLINDPQPDPMDYIVQMNNVDAPPLEAVDPSSQNSFLMESQRSIYLSPQKLPSSQESNFSSEKSSPSGYNKTKSQCIADERLLKTEQPGPSCAIDVKIENIKSETMRDNVEVIDLTDSIDENNDTYVKMETEEPENDCNFETVGLNIDREVTVEVEIEASDKLAEADQVRKSRRNLVKKSPAWKSLIPGQRVSVNFVNITENGGKETVIKEENDSEEILKKSRRSDNAINSPNSARQGASVKRNLIENLNESLKPKVTSTPCKTPVTKKQLLQAGLNMSPITKFFKRIEPSDGDRTDHSSKPDHTDNQATTVKGGIDQYDQTDTGNKSITRKKSDVSVVLESNFNSSTDKTDTSDRVRAEQSTNYVESVGDKVVDQSGHQQCTKRLNQSSGKKLAGKGDRKRKSPDSDNDDTFSNEPSNCKRVTRSTPTKSKENLLTRTPEKAPDINDFTTIYVSPSKRKSMTEKFASPLQVTPVRNRLHLLNEATASEGSDRMSSQEKSPADGRRKRKAEYDYKLEQVLTDIKRRKIGTTEWCSSVLTVDLRKTENVPESVCMPSTSFEIFLATLEDGFTFEALQFLNSQITFKFYPQSRIISELMRNVLLNAEEEITANMSYNILSHVLMLHPPISAALQDVYLRALAGCKEGEEWQVGAEWNFIHQCFSNLLVSDNAQFKKNNLLLFRFILQLLQQNQKHLNVLQKDCDTRHMLLRIVWSPSYHVVFNKRCRALVEVMSDIIQTYQANLSDTENSLLLEVLDGVLWMVAMVTECCRCLECGNGDILQTLQASNTSAFVHEISRKLINLDVRDVVLLENIFHGLQLPWLRVGVCQQLLNTLDDYLLAEDSLQDTKSLTLTLIVTRYLYLLPVFDVLPRNPGQNSPARTRTKKCTKTLAVLPTNCLTENTDINKENIEKMSLKANKRNPKGETPLHVACIRNNVTAVKKLLGIPGIDVNATDYVGWTPLHEACNHGNIECVRELLKFVPSKIVDAFLKRDSAKCRKVDLMAGNSEGITPLHDAVLCNHLEVCQLLLQHGGPKLLEAKTILGYTPLDLAETEDMMALLSSYSQVRRRHNDSVNLTGSQDSTISVDKSVPSETQYEQVIFTEGERIYVNLKSALHYIQLISLLIKHYISLRNLNAICKGMEEDQCQPPENLCQKEKQNDGDNKLKDDCDSNINSQGVRKQAVDCISHVFNRSQLTARQDRTGFHREDMIPTVSQEEVAILISDLKILKNMPRYIKLFKTHLSKICRKEDLVIIENELQHLAFITEGLQC